MASADAWAAGAPTGASGAGESTAPTDAGCAGRGSLLYGSAVSMIVSMRRRSAPSHTDSSLSGRTLSTRAFASGV